MTLLNPIPFRLTDQAGNPINGGTLTAYVSGTTTLADIYADRSRTTPLANPLSCDDNGMFADVFGKQGITYDLYWADETGTVLDSTLGWDGSATVDEPVDSEGGSTRSYTEADWGHIVRRTYAGTMTDTLPDSVATGNGKTVTIWSDGDGGISVQVSGGGTIDGSATRVIAQGDRVKFISRGAEWTADGAPLKVGLRATTLPAGAWAPTTTGGCSALAQAETGTYLVNYKYLSFADAAIQYAFLNFDEPYSYGGGNLQARFTYLAMSAGGTVRFGIQGQMWDDGDTLDAAWGSAREITDTVLGTTVIATTAWGTFTASNADGDSLAGLRIYRDGVADTNTGAIRLISVQLRQGIARSTDDDTP